MTDTDRRRLLCPDGKHHLIEIPIFPYRSELTCRDCQLVVTALALENARYPQQAIRDAERDLAIKELES